MAKVFISYCSKNRELVEAFMEFLQLGMGVHRSDIFCTVYSEALPTGTDFIAKIREQLRECTAVISLITEEYLKSPFCMVEMGAAWAMCGSYFPILTVPFEKLKNTPLQNMQMRRLSSVEDLSAIYDELHTCGVLTDYQTARIYKKVAEFVQLVEKLSGADFLIPKDGEGYYEAVIESVRPLRDRHYRCYRIRGQIADPPDGETANSDWLFYWENVFPDLQAGDRVRFKTTRSKVNVFPDLGKARNLYPDDLKKLED